MAHHERDEELDLERVVVLQEGAQEVGLVPGYAFLDPIFGVLERVKNIVEVNVHARRKHR